MVWFSNHYEILRALHIIIVIAWMAGLMYLPRLYVYHSSAIIGSELDDTLKIMEHKLYNYIMQPMIILAWVLGLMLIMARGGHYFILNGFFIIKLISVTLISIIHIIYGKWLKDFAQSKRPLNHVFFRLINELPFILMIIGVFMVVLEPKI